MTYPLLFLFGLVVGSFMNVLALRYDGEHFLFNPRVIGGRSRCPHCKRILRWFELIPLVSYLAQWGRCRNCGIRIGLHYPLMELLSALVFVLVPLRFASYPWLVDVGWYIFSGLWILGLEILLLIAYIDLRLQIVPDELVILLGIVAVFETIFAGAYLGTGLQSFIGVGVYGNIWLSHAVGALLGAGFFGALVAVTRGRGMGIGDVKLALPLGFLFGWPDILFLSAFAFIVGAMVGIALILGKRKTMKSAVPFAPFLVVGAVFVFFFGGTVLGWYFRIIGL